MRFHCSKVLKVEAYAPLHEMPPGPHINNFTNNNTFKTGDFGWGSVEGTLKEIYGQVEAEGKREQKQEGAPFQPCPGVGLPATFFHSRGLLLLVFMSGRR
jgi:hypothetical protein